MLVVATTASADVIAHYRFEEGAAGQAADGPDSIEDSIGLAHGTPTNAPIYSDDVAGETLSTGQANTRSMEFTGAEGQAVQFPSIFALHRQFDAATLEFSVKYDHQAHQGIFWTRIGDDDENRFNIFTTHDPGRQSFGYDYRAPGGSHQPVCFTECFTVTPNEWTHIVLRRDGNQWETFKNGACVGSITLDPASGAQPLPEAIGWEISGRGGFHYRGFLDEVRLSDHALDPSEFLFPGLEGDTNGDRIVDSADVQALADAFGSTGACDLNGDGVIDNRDLLEALGNFGAEGEDPLVVGPAPSETLTYLSTGEVVLDTAQLSGGRLSGFVLTSASGSFTSNVAFPEGNGTEIATPTQVSWSNVNDTPISGMISLGFLLPAGLTEQAATADLDGSSLVGGRGTGLALVIRPTDPAELLCQAIALIEGLTPDQIRNRGNRKALIRTIEKAKRELSKGKIDAARKKIGKALERADGCTLRGAPDDKAAGHGDSDSGGDSDSDSDSARGSDKDSDSGSGTKPRQRKTKTPKKPKESKDYVVDCDAQAALYDLLSRALNGLE
jgi:hypothetical protein